ncbi:MAG TPA: hypothetical protein DCE42_24610 [Myxococcales bacterium]|nr:hypothetical protein [Deltaproteobacteria bacterium]MBU51317.1 hypothetical protein [Deltaproteobacteria bacterium]HAA57970.1 hypothetical protein [Myxococcales bacterium]
MFGHRNAVGDARKRRLSSFWLLLLMMTAIGCSQGSSSGGCSCAEPIPGGFPQAKKIGGVGQVALTRRALQFIENNNQLLIKQFLPNGLSFDIQNNGKICTNGSKSNPCKVTGKINKLQLTPAAPNKLNVKLNVNISSSKIQIKQKVLLVTVKCDVTASIKNRDIKVAIGFGIDNRNKHLKLNIGQPDITINSSDFKISGNLACKAANLLKGLFKSTIQKQIDKALKDALSGLSCMSCQAQADCPTGSTCKGGTCNQGGSCLPMPIGTEGQTDVSSLLGSFGNKSSNKMLFSVFMGSTASANAEGIFLGALGGTDSKWHSCVPKKTFPALPKPPAYSFPAKTPDGKNYMMGLVLSQVFFDAASRDIYKGGLLCVNIDESLSPQIAGVLNAQGLGALISPSLLKLTKDSPMYIALRPSQPPEFKIGKGTFKTNAKGEKVIDQPLLELAVPRLGFDFFLMLHDRWIRLFTYRVDLSLPIGLEVRPGNKVGLVMGDLGSSMTNPTVENSHILKEDPTKMASGLETLLKSALPALAGSLGGQEFDLPDVSGFRISLQSITGQVARTDNPKLYKFLALYADLSVAPKGTPQLPSLSVDMTASKIHYPTNFRTQIKDRQHVTEFPSTQVTIHNYDPKREYSFKINKGMWGYFRAGRTHRIESPQFVLQGRHVISVRSRLKDYPAASAHTDGWTALYVDYTAPKVTTSVSSRGLTVRTDDNVAAQTDIETMYRLDKGEWKVLRDNDTISYNELSKGKKVEVRTIDPQGNVTTQQVDWQKDATQLPPEANTACGCQTSHQEPAQGFFLLGLFALLWLGLRKKHQRG